MRRQIRRERRIGNLAITLVHEPAYWSFAIMIDGGGVTIDFYHYQLYIEVLRIQ